jgi:hypothetical protein
MRLHEVPRADEKPVLKRQGGESERDDCKRGNANTEGRSKPLLFKRKSRVQGFEYEADVHLRLLPDMGAMQTDVRKSQHVFLQGRESEVRAKSI